MYSQFEKSQTITIFKRITDDPNEEESKIWNSDIEISELNKSIPKNTTVDLNLEDNLRDLKQDPMTIIQDHEHTIEEQNTMIYELIKNHHREVAYLQNKRDEKIH